MYCRRDAAARTGYVSPGRTANDAQARGTAVNQNYAAAYYACMDEADGAPPPGDTRMAGGPDGAYAPGSGDPGSGYGPGYYDAYGPPPPAYYNYGAYPAYYPYYGPAYGPAISFGFGYRGRFGGRGFHRR